MGAVPEDTADSWATSGAESDSFWSSPPIEKTGPSSEKAEEEDHTPDEPSTDDRQPTDEYDIALPSTPEPFVEITAGSADDEHAAEDDDAADVEVDSDIADEISSLSEALAAGTGDVTIEHVDPEDPSDSEQQTEVDEIEPAGAESVLAAITELGGEDAELEIVAEQADDTQITDDADQAAALPDPSDLFGFPQIDEPSPPDGPEASDDDWSEDAGRSLFTTDSSPLFSDDEIAAGDESATAEPPAATFGDPTGSTDDLDEPASEPAPDDGEQPSGLPSASLPGSVDTPETGRASEPTFTGPEVVVADASAAATSTADIPDELPSWAVDHAATPEPGDEPGDAPSGASDMEEAAQGAEALWPGEQQEASPNGLDAPFSSHPVPAAYKELESLPSVPGEPRSDTIEETAAEVPTADTTPTSEGLAGRPEADEAPAAEPEAVPEGEEAPTREVPADPFTAPASVDSPAEVLSGLAVEEAAVGAPATEPATETVPSRDEGLSPQPEGDDSDSAEVAAAEVEEEATPAAESEVAPTEPATDDIGPAKDEELPAPVPAAGDDVLRPAQWASRWAESAQGWVDLDGDGSPTEWRPIVATVETISGWKVETYLGLVSGDATLSDHTDLAAAREAATAVMVEESLVRGAHAVIGVDIAVVEVHGSTFLTATGTAVTLAPAG